jgi:hypothetical protein
MSSHGGYVSTNALAKVFADLTDEALIQRFQSGALTEAAQAIARAEIAARGLSIPDESKTHDDSDDEAVPGDLVPIARGLKPLEARVLQGRFEAEGIYAFVADEGLMNALPIWAHAAYGGGARVLVRSEQAQEAAKILAAWKNDEYQVTDEKDDQPE